jgi:transcriptional regulator with XRE-family HTH domain
MPRARNDALVAAFGEVLSEARSRAGLTQEELAFESDIDRTFVGLLETGKRQPTISVLFGLARALRINPETLVERARKRLELCARDSG